METGKNNNILNRYNRYACKALNRSKLWLLSYGLPKLVVSSDLLSGAMITRANTLAEQEGRSMLFFLLFLGSVAMVPEAIEALVISPSPCIFPCKLLLFLAKWRIV